MNTRSHLLRDPELTRTKAIGSLAGLAIGDTLGDLGRSDAYRQRHGIATRLTSGTQSTDDTEFAVLTATLVIASRGHLTDQVVLDHWQEYVVQGGIHSRSGLVAIGARANLMRGMRPPLSGEYNVQSYDDGVAMRVAPIGIVWAGAPRKAAEMAEVDGRISHTRDGIWAGRAVAAAVAAAMVDATIDEILDAAMSVIPGDSWLGDGMRKAMAICDEESSFLRSWERLHEDLWTPHHAAAAEAIPQAFALLRMTGDRGFTEALVAACNFGRDADTIGAVVGAVCGAKYGTPAIPDDWIEQVRRPRGVCLPFTRDVDIVRLAEDIAFMMPDVHE